MNDVNIVVLNGNVTRDAELRYAASGSAITKFSIANNRSYKVGEEWKEETSFLNCVMFGKGGEALSEKLKKGSPVQVIGRLKQNSWEDNGVKKSTIEVVVDNARIFAKKDTLPVVGNAVPNAEEPIPF